MLSIAFEPLLSRLRYVTARAMYLLRHQKLAVSEWMCFLAEGPGARLSSPLFTQHLQVMRSCPIVRDLVYHAYDEAVAAVGAQKGLFWRGLALGVGLFPTHFHQNRCSIETFGW